MTLSSARQREPDSGDPRLVRNFINTLRHVDRTKLRQMWERQAAGLGYDGNALAEATIGRSRAGPDLSDGPHENPVDAATAWAVAHLSEREAVFSRTHLLAATLTWRPGAVTMPEAEAAPGIALYRKLRV